MQKNIEPKTIKTLLLFLLTSVIIIYFLPTQVSFNYTYQKGRPWQNEDLIAPFDFAIYKTELELKAEKDSALKNFKPYFVLEESVIKEAIYKFKSSFDSLYSISLNKTCKKNENTIINDFIKEEIYKESKNILAFIYEKGVTDLNSTPNDVNRIIDNKKSIVVLKNNIANDKRIKEIFTPKTAYNYIASKISNISKNEPTKSEIIDKLGLFNFVEPCIFYDAKKTEKAKANVIQNISLTQGIVQAGERIVSKGDLINNTTYRELESLKKESKSNIGANGNIYWVYVGQSIIVIAFMLIFYLFLWYFHYDIINNYRKILLVISLILLLFLSASLLQKYSFLNIYIVPFVMIIIVINSFFKPGVAFFTYILTILISSLLAPNSLEFIFIQFITGGISIFFLSKIYKRVQLFTAVGLVILSYTLIYTAMAVIKESSLHIENPNYYTYFIINGLLLLASYPLIFLFEKIFRFISDATLLELSDTNNKILRQLAEKAPGTFQHVMQVANLSEEAIRKIGGNTLLIRTGALYHDIGKIGAPAFFIENQSGTNPHDKLSYEESAEVIINHVVYGLELAKKHKLPKVITDFIGTHHGNSVVKYFYTKQVNEVGEENVDISKFTYPGITPFSKETAVLMMADAVEAASRAMKEYNETSIDKLVEGIIDSQLNDGQFNDANITFKDISKIKEVFKQKLQNIYHTRIEYPKMEKSATTKKQHKVKNIIKK